MNAKKVVLGIFTAVAVLTSSSLASALADSTKSVSQTQKQTTKTIQTFREFKVDDGDAKADIKVPVITNMENKALEATLNNKYLEESKKLYNDFTADMEELKKNGGGHLGIKGGYDVKTDNDQILAVGRYVVSTVNSFSEYTYDTIDKKNQLLITLPSLFKDDSYINLINKNIKEQMRQQMKADPEKVYWESFETIDKNQSFYINDQGKLVIVFNKYEVAPGSMGVLEFIIPTNVITDALVSNEYIK